MTIPSNKTTTHSTDIETIKKEWRPGEKIPVVHSLSSSFLEKHGWVHFDKNKMKKGKNEIYYNGVVFILNGKIELQFQEDLIEELKKIEDGNSSE